MNSSEIAKLAHVSRSTVSRVINNYPDISEETKARVKKVIKENNYVPNVNGLALAGKPNKVIGLFIVDSENTNGDPLVISRSEVFTTLVSFISDIAQDINYNILISIINEQHKFDIQRLFLSKSICGGIIVGDTYDQTIIDKLGQQGYKIVLHNQREMSNLPNIINVNVDNEKFAYIATKELLSKGHRKIGLISGNFKKYTVQKRYAGFIKAMQEYHVDFDNRYIGTGNFHRDSGGYEATNQLIKKYWNQLPSALLVLNSVMTPGVLQALSEANLRVPDDISVIGVGGSPQKNQIISDISIDNQLIASAMISKLTELLTIGELSNNNIVLSNYKILHGRSIKAI